jgi:hypothetical protein
MTFHPRALVVFAVFVIGLWLAVGWSRGTVGSGPALAGIVALVTIELLVFLGPVFLARPRERNGVARR